MKYLFYNICIFIFLIILRDINSITEKDLETINGNIDENNIENEINQIIQDFNEFNSRYTELVERENKEIDSDDYDRTKYKEKYRKLFDEGGLFYEYFYKQRKRLSNIINKPTGKISEHITNAHDSLTEYVLESKQLVTELGEKTFMDKSDL